MADTLVYLVHSGVVCHGTQIVWQSCINSCYVINEQFVVQGRRAAALDRTSYRF